jgi:NHL repeat
MGSMTARRLTLGIVVWLCALVGVFVFSSVAAEAFVTHEYLPVVSGEVSKGVPASSSAPLHGPLSDVPAMTVDSGGLYVAEGPVASYRLDKFDASSGVFVSQFAQVPSLSYLHEGVAVAHATGEVYVGGDESLAGGTKGVVAAFDAAGSLQGVWKGTPSEEFGCFDCSGPGDVAVDNSVEPLADPAAGFVYVADPTKKVVDVFKPQAGGKGEFKTQLLGTCAAPGTCPGEETPFGGPNGVAVDPSNGDVLVADSKVVDVFEPTVLGQYAFVRQITGTPAGVFGGAGGGVGGVSVDGGNGDVYVVENIGARGLIVDQFSAAGVFLGQLTGTPSGPFSQVESVAVDPSSHDVYVGEPGRIIVFGPSITVPDVTSEPATNLTPRSATLNGSVNPDKAGEATCRFVWGTTQSFGETAHCPGTVPNGESPVAVSAGIEGLQPDTTYYYRLQATNIANGQTNPGEPSQDQEFRTTGPGIHEEGSSNVALSSATLNVRIDPNGAPTTYYFQYGTSGAYGTDTPASPGLALGSGSGDVAVSRHLQGLFAGTVYHFRAVAVSELKPGVFETFDGPDRSFTTQMSGVFALPDGRSWEMVSPPDKHGALITPIGAAPAIQASGGGSAMTFVTFSPIGAEPQGYTNKVQVFSTRGPDGWSSRDIAIPHNAATGLGIGQGQEYRIFSSDLSLAVVHPFGSFNPSLSAEASESTAYLRTNYLHGDVNDPCVSSCFRPLVTGKAGFANVPPGTVFGESNSQLQSGSRACPPILTCGPEFVAATPDLSRIFLNYFRGLTSGSSGEIYEWAGGSLRANGQLPSPRVLTSEDGSYSYSVSGTSIFVSHAGSTKLVAELSAEDSKDFSTDTQHLSELTLRVSPDGRWLTFMSQRELTGYDNHDAVSGKPDEEVYVYDAVAGRLVCASCNPTGSRPVGVEEEQFKFGSLTGTARIWPGNTWIAASVPGWKESPSRYQSRYLADNGRLFFDSSDALVPGDVNGTQDVYQYEPVGVGDCSPASSTFSQSKGGCVGLISSGKSAEESGFMDASENGSDVFFLTTAKLSPQDYDTAVDIYDAHECTTSAPCFASQSVLPPPCVTGDACKPSRSPQPAVFGSPSSATFSGAGNVSPSAPGSVVKPKSLTRAQKLAQALRACGKKHDPKQKSVCRRKARQRYGAGLARRASATKMGRG